MDFELTEEQSLLQTAVREFAEEVVRPRAAPIDQSGQFPKDLFHKAGQLGLAGVSVPPGSDGIVENEQDALVVAKRVEGRYRERCFRGGARRRRVRTAARTR